MAEYLSPGVYVEEFDSGIKAMEGVGTSTAGFVGMAKKGPVRGLPVLVTSMADYQRRFGGYLPERIYGDKRFLPYAVEQFFNNGGSSCYIMRVCGAEGEEGAPVPASGRLWGEKEEDAFLTLTAENPGAWGNAIQAGFTLAAKNRTRVKGKGADDTVIQYELEDASAFQEQDLVCLRQAKKDSPFCFGLVKEVNGAKLTLEWQGENAAGLEFQEEGKGGENAGDNTEKVSPGVFLYLAEWNLSIQDDTASEQYEGISFNPNRSNFIKNLLEKSRLVKVKLEPEKLKANMEILENAQLAAAGASGGQVGQLSVKFEEESEEMFFGMQLVGGSDGDIKPDVTDASMYLGHDGAPDERTGLAAFQTISDVSIMAIPGITEKSVQSALVTHCENRKDRFAILDMPFDKKEVPELQGFRGNVDSSYAAMYHPWLQCYDPLAKKNVFLPPSGAMAGIYGRTDNTRGVHKAPANEVVRSCTGLSINYNEAEQAKLNPKGINLIRTIPGQGIRVWGARTCSSDGNWKYINVRRLFIFLESSIRANTNWAVFEPNDEMLWSRVEGTIRVFLTTQWRNGALAGTTAEEAFFINIGKSTMTEDDILNGRLICVIGVAPVRPAEFVIFRITQKMENAQ